KSSGRVPTFRKPTPGLGESRAASVHCDRSVSRAVFRAAVCEDGLHSSGRQGTSEFAGPFSPSSRTDRHGSRPQIDTCDRTNKSDDKKRGRTKEGGIPFESRIEFDGIPNSFFLDLRERGVALPGCFRTKNASLVHVVRHKIGRAHV